MNTATKPGDTVKIEGIDYVILSAKPYTHNGDARIAFTMKRPRGKRSYYVVRYGNGAVSSVV
jgi:hypothetical protein